MSCAPILLIGFNRPDFMAAQIAAVRAARPARLYVAVDGPREGRPDEAEKCRAVRECVKLVDWPCEVKTLFREKNLGCKYGVSGAITWFFDQEEEGIVLEDDCRPSPDFFRFATEMLVRYRDDERIGAINGFNFFNLQSDKTASYHFSSHMEVWGWASWRRVWNRYDVEIREYKPRLLEVVGKSRMAKCARKGFIDAVRSVERGLNTWDVQFSLAFLCNGWLSVVPRERLIANAGIDDQNATHTGGFDYHAGKFSRVGRVDFPLVHPKAVVADVAADRRREKMSEGYYARALTWFGSKFPFLRKPILAWGAFTERCLPFLFNV